VKTYVGLPTDRVDLGDEFVSAAGIAELAVAAEQAGFHGVFVTEHPFPVDDWLGTGGHHALDPFVALSFAAAATTRLRVFTYLCVLPYRNPFLTAKAAASLDVLSGGRLDLGVGAGYLQGEFAALGVDFDERNELFDEAITAITKAWTEDGVELAGRHFVAAGNTMQPKPVQSPRPPIWVGGNARAAIRRAAHLADGWLPMPNARATVARRRSPALETVDDLRGMLDVLRAERREAGRDGRFDVIAMPLVPYLASMPGFDADRLAEHAAELSALGVTGLSLGLPAVDRATHVEALAEFGGSVLPVLTAIPQSPGAPT
jgi:probable F420-dependent oxidoreductase